MIEIVCSGFGGQGVLTLGLILANAAAKDGKNVTWIPSYGSEMRGGSANCHIKISDGLIASPFVKKMDILVALNEVSLNKFGSNVKKGGCIIVNSSIVENIPHFEDVTVIKLPANDIASRNNNPRGMSMAIIGGIIAYSDLFSVEVTAQTIEDYFSGKKVSKEVNNAVFLEGYNYVLNLISGGNQ